jgi:hypothetical protein
MQKATSEGPVIGPQPDNLKLRKLIVRLGNAYVRLTPRDRRKVMRLLKQLAFGKADSASYWDLWSKDDAKSCYLLLRPISTKMSNDFRRWTSEHLRARGNCKLVLKCLMDELEVRTWIEEP